MKKLEEYEPSSGILQKNVLKQPKTKCPAKLRAPSGPGVPAFALRSSPVYNLLCTQVQDLFSYLYFFSWPALHRQYIDNIASFTASQFVTLSGKLIE